MSVHTPNLSWTRGVICLLVAACGGAPAEPVRPAKAPEAPAKAAPAAEPAKPAPSEAAPGKLAEVREDVPLPLTRFLGQSVADVQAQLGEHLTKGMMRETCVRFVPKRTFFSCKYALQRYADKTGNFESIQMIYEDGVAAAIALDGWKHAAGPFDPQALLTAVGLALPEPGDESSPAANVRLWKWFNQQARLKIAGKQYRVEVSVIDDQWARSRVEVTLNEPLTPEQKAKIVLPANAKPGDAKSE